MHRREYFWSSICYIVSLKYFFQGICIFPFLYNLLSILLFDNFLFLIAKNYKKANQFLELSLKSSKQKETFEAFTDIILNLNEVTNILLSCFQRFVVVSIASQFIMSLYLCYNIFLHFIGQISLSSYMLLSTYFWIIFQFSTILAYIVGCDGIIKEINHALKVVWRYRITRTMKLEKVIIGCHIFNNLFYLNSGSYS